MLDTASLAIGAICIILASRAIYLWHDPHPELQHLPRASPFVRTGLWLRWQELQGVEVTTIHDLHRELGPVIRLSGNAISVSTDSAELRAIHTKTGCANKSAQYEHLLITFHRPIFGLRDAREHAARRSGFGRSYLRVMNYLEGAENTLVTHVGIMHGQNVNVKDVFWSSVVQANQMLLFGASQTWPPVISHDETCRQRGGEAVGYGSPIEKLRLIGLLPAWLRRRLRSRVLRSRAARWVDHGCAAAAEDSGSEMPCSRIMQHLRTEMTGMPGTDRLLSLEQEKVLYQRVRDEMIDQLNGGTDFPLAALTCALCLLAQPAHQHWQDQIREPGEGKAAAFVNEVLRLFPPAAGSQPRELVRPIVLPCHGASLTLQPGVVVHAQPFTLHRDGMKFFDPESFQPERCLGDGAARTSDLWAFGKGPTHCIAQEFAMKVMKRLLKIACETARFDVKVGSLALNPSQGLLLSLPEEMFVRVRLRQ